MKVLHVHTLRRGKRAKKPLKQSIGRLLIRREAILSELSKVENLIERTTLVKGGVRKSGRISAKDLDALLDRNIRSTPKAAPLPADFSRADLYEDHD